jgi:hypothetical protein
LPRQRGGKAPLDRPRARSWPPAGFKLLGEGEKFSGKVNFTEDEASGKKTGDE